MSEEQSTFEKEEANEPADKTIGLGFGDALELQPGQIIAERYRVIEELGRGGMGVVYRVEQITLARELALKTLNCQDVKDSTWLRFQQEAKATSMLDHPNLISVHDSGLIEGKHPYFVMDLVKGTTLAKLVKEKGPLSVEETLPIFTQVCFGLAYAHDVGIVHRDLKPSNIMLIQPSGGGAFKAKIVDFGIAKLHMADSADVQELTKTGEIFGSPLYMSPEQCLGVAVDHRSDIYALGCVLFESLTGLPPLMGNTALSTMMKHQSEPPPSLKEATLGKDFAPEIEELVARLLAKNPDNRYQSLKVLARDLSLLQQGISSQSLSFNCSTPVERNYQRGTHSLSDMVKVSLATALLTGVSVWFIKHQIDSELYLQKLTAELKRYDAKTSAFQSVSKSGNSVQSYTVERDGNKAVRRIYFVKPIGEFKICGEETKHVAAGIHEIPFEKSISLIVKDTEVVLSPYFFYQFQPADISELSLENNIGVTDNTLASINHLKVLHSLNLSDTDVSDASVEQINKLPRLDRLSLEGTRITDRGILGLKRLPNLILFGAKELNDAGKILKKLKNSELIQSLTLEKSSLNDADAQLIATMKNLTDLNLKETRHFDDRCLKSISTLKKLRFIDLTATSVTSAGLLSLKEFPNLKTVFIGINDCVDEKFEQVEAALQNVTIKRKVQNGEIWR